MTTEQIQVKIEERYVHFLAAYFQDKQDDYSKHHAEEAEAILTNVLQVPYFRISELRKQAKQQSVE